MLVLIFLRIFEPIRCVELYSNLGQDDSHDPQRIERQLSSKNNGS
jgi:hypothetical protein